MPRLEDAMSEADRVMSGLAWDLRLKRMTQKEHAEWLNGVAIAGRTAEAYHARVAERQRYERIERERLQAED